jgi:hypothetical protein
MAYIIGENYGKKAILKGHDCTYGFEVGEVVTIIGETERGDRFKIQSTRNVELEGYVSRSLVEFVEEKLGNGIVEVTFEGATIKGEVKDVVALIKELHQLSKPVDEKEGAFIGMLAQIRENCGDKNALHGFEDGDVVEITRIEDDDRFPYTVKKGSHYGYANDSELIFLF